MAGFLKKIYKAFFLIVLAAVAIPVGIVYSVIETTWGSVYAFFRGVSKIVSICASKLLNKLLIESSGFKFGTYSVSAVLGVNQRKNKLKPLGVWLSNLLDSIEPNHCRKASERAGI
jgi:predicted Co/Zn/Cd cation transporter (cation efflux family)